MRFSAFAGVVLSVTGLVQTAFAGDARVGVCELLLIDAVPLAAIHLEHVPASSTLSKAAKKRVRRAPQPVLETLTLVDSLNPNAPMVAEARYRVEKAEGQSALLKIEGIAVNAEFVEVHGLSLERGLLARVLEKNPDVRRVSLRLSNDSMRIIDGELARLDPAMDLTPSYAAAVGTKRRFDANVRIGARVRELLQPHEQVPPVAQAKAIVNRALGATPEFELARALGFGRLLDVGAGPEIQTLELVLGR